MPAPKKIIQLSALIFLFSFFTNNCFAQFGNPIKWSADGNGFYRSRFGSIILTSLPDNKESTIIAAEKLTPQGSSSPLGIQSFSFSNDNQKLLIYTNSKKVWRYNTRGDY